ncbi:hypothetical protein Psuf_060430 [Phytohabitans suffuscus]|uniref:Uncharacterized protein n=1 Tax=Phytohabitans suffuscus TaxID=624315 RepID=A0A6F8YRF4_9ACTN|nr:hypothetical protein Psuf_060430 [Phytohabitans suffuscus]
MFHKGMPGLRRVQTTTSGTGRKATYNTGMRPSARHHRTPPRPRLGSTDPYETRPSPLKTIASADNAGRFVSRSRAEGYEPTGQVRLSYRRAVHRRQQAARPRIGSGTPLAFIEGWYSVDATELPSRVNLAGSWAAPQHRSTAAPAVPPSLAVALASSVLNASPPEGLGGHRADTRSCR